MFQRSFNHHLEISNFLVGPEHSYQRPTIGPDLHRRARIAPFGRRPGTKLGTHGQAFAQTCQHGKSSPVHPGRSFLDSSPDSRWLDHAYFGSLSTGRSAERNDPAIIAASRLAGDCNLGKPMECGGRIPVLNRQSVKPGGTGAPGFEPSN